MPSLLGTTVTNNYLKTAPTTQFGTREIVLIKVLVGGTNASMVLVDGSTADVGGVLGHSMSNSIYSSAVRSLQNFAEVYAVYTPVATGFLALIAVDTANSSDTATGTQPVTTGYGQAEAAIKAAIQAINEQTNVTVTISEPAVTIGTTL
jgi:hypothetical protein